MTLIKFSDPLVFNSSKKTILNIIGTNPEVYDIPLSSTNYSFNLLDIISDNKFIDENYISLNDNGYVFNKDVFISVRLSAVLRHTATLNSAYLIGFEPLNPSAIYTRINGYNSFLGTISTSGAYFNVNAEVFVPAGNGLFLVPQSTITTNNNFRIDNNSAINIRSVINVSLI